LLTVRRSEAEAGSIAVDGAFLGATIGVTVGAVAAARDAALLQLLLGSIPSGHCEAEDGVPDEEEGSGGELHDGCRFRSKSSRDGGIDVVFSDADVVKETRGWGVQIFILGEQFRFSQGFT
jgi:hypothetical protein